MTKLVIICNLSQIRTSAEIFSRGGGGASDKNPEKKHFYASSGGDNKKKKDRKTALPKPLSTISVPRMKTQGKPRPPVADAHDLKPEICRNSK